MRVLAFADFVKPVALQQCIGANPAIEVREIRTVQHFMRHDQVEDCLALARVEIERA